MPKAYSRDLRERVSRYVDAGHSRHTTAAHFGVSVSFVVNLMKIWRSSGRLDPKPGGGRRYSKLDPHREFLLCRIDEKDDLTMPELAAELAARHACRPGFNLPLVYSKRLSLKKKRYWPASKIARTSGRRARLGSPGGKQEWGLSRIVLSSLMKPARRRR